MSGIDFNSKIRLEILDTPIAIEDLDIEFEIKLTKEQTPNEASVTIWNLSESTKQILKEDSTGIRILYKSATDTSFVQIYEGFKRFKIRTVKKTKRPSKKKSKPNINRYMADEIDGADVATTIELAENRLNYNNITYYKSFSNKVTTKDVIQSIANEFNAPVVYLNDIPHQTYANGVAFSDSAKSAMSKVCDRVGLDWTFLNGKIYLSSKKNPVPSGSLVNAYLLNGANSETPEYEDNKEIKIKTVLTPYINTASIVRVEMKDVDGAFGVVKVDHKGSNCGGDNYSEITIREN